MKHRLLYTAIVAAALLTPVISGNCRAQKAQAKGGGQKAWPAPMHLPAALNDLYPPKAQEPVLLMKMHAMNEALTGMIADLSENDGPNAKSNYEQFRKEYVEASKLVRDWTPAFTQEPLDQLGKALATGDQGKVMGAVAKVGQVCHECHLQNMTPVQQKFHWPDFRNVGVTDPVMKTQVDYAQLMQGINLGFTGMGVDLKQGQVENARKHFDAFRTRFETLKETCIACHDTERKYYTDATVLASIDQLGAAISGPSIDPEKVKKLSIEIGTESCMKCHLVHLPATHAKAKWGPPVM